MISKKNIGVLGDSPDARKKWKESLMETTEKLGEKVGIQPACISLGLNRSRYYRIKKQNMTPIEITSRPRPPLSLSDEERQETLDVLRSERFMDQAPAVVYTTLLEEQSYLCSIRTMYRILAMESEVRERRNQKKHPHYKKARTISDQFE